MDEKINNLIQITPQLNPQNYIQSPSKIYPMKKQNLSSFKLRQEQVENLDLLIKRYLPKSSPLKPDKKQQIEYMDTLLKESEQLIQQSQKTSIQNIYKSINGLLDAKPLKQSEISFNVPLDKTKEINMFEFRLKPCQTAQNMNQHEQALQPCQTAQIINSHEQKQYEVAQGEAQEEQIQDLDSLAKFVTKKDNNYSHYSYTATKHKKYNTFYVHSEGISVISAQKPKINFVPREFPPINRDIISQAKKFLSNTFSNQNGQNQLNENDQVFEKYDKIIKNFKIQQEKDVESPIKLIPKEYQIGIGRPQLGQESGSVPIPDPLKSTQQEKDEYIKNLVKKYGKPPPLTEDKISANNASKVLYNPRQIQKIQKKKIPITIDQIQIREQLGKGKFSQVFKGIINENQFQVAVKIIKKTDIEKYQMADLVMQEIKILSYLNHPNIIKLYGVTQDNTNIYLIQEYATHGTLYQKLKSSYQQKMSEKQCAIYINQIISALRYMHDFHIIHRDLKPENIMLIYDEIKLVDFGCTCYSPYDTESIVCGTIDYVAPEMINQDCYGCSVDLWSLGILTYELLIGNTPFSGYIDREEIQNQIVQANIDYNHDISDVAKDFIRMWLQRMPQHRESLENAQQHPFIQSNLQLKQKQIEDIF